MSTERRMKRKAGESGFTMVEMLIVVVIIGIMTAAAYPGIARYRRNYQIRAATDQVAGVIQAARLRAITRNATRGIYVATLDNRRYVVREVEKDAVNPVPFAALRRLGRDLDGDGVPDEDIVHALPEGVVFGTPAATASTIGFNSLGMLCTAANFGCATLTATPGTNLIAVALTGATLTVQQPSTGLRRTILVSTGGRVTR